jgi:hypothetical protein
MEQITSYWAVYVWFGVGWKGGVKYFDREKDLSKRPLGIKENDVKGERLYTGYIFFRSVSECHYP